MNKKADNSGWILCPSKSHPGKFYYFNIHNGESAWSLYDNEKGMFKNDGTLHKNVVDSPKPITPPENQIARTCYNNLRRCSTTFGAVKFPKYITSNEDSAIIWAPICKSKLLTNDNTKIDQCTQTDMYFNQSQPTPVFKDFQFNKNTSINALDRSTSANRTDAGQISSKTIPKRVLYSKACLLKETRLKTYKNETEINEKSNCYSNNMQNSTISDGRKVQHTMKDVEKLHCDSYDLRFVLRAKKRKSNDTNDTLVSTKEIFNTNGNKGTNTQTDTESTKDWYIVVDSDVLLQEFDFIISYINKDDTCYLYIPKIVEEQLKSAAIGDQSEFKSPEISEHWKRKSSTARSIQRRLENYKSKLNLPECTQDTAVNQIVKCCSDIMQRNKDVMLVTNDEELLKIATSHQIRASTVRDLKKHLCIENDINKYTKNNENLFLQDIAMFEPLSLSKFLKNTEGYKQNDCDPSNKDMSCLIYNMSKLKLSNPRGRREENTFKVNGTNYNDMTQSLSLNNDSISEQKMCDQQLMISAPKDTENSNHNDEKSINCIDSESMSFYVNNDIVEKNLCLRSEEFVCHLDQIVEEFLYIVSQEKQRDVSQPRPWSIQDGLESLKDIYKDNKQIADIVKKLADLYISVRGDNNIKPYKFMLLFEHWYRLVQAVEEKKPNDPGVGDIKRYLDSFRENLSQAMEDVPLGSPSPRSDDGDACMCSFLKNPSEVSEYIRTHFPECKRKEDDRPANVVHQLDIKIVRMSGRHLSNFTIDKTKRMNILSNDEAGVSTEMNNTPKVIKNISYQSKVNDTVNQSNDNQLIDQSLTNDYKMGRFAYSVLRNFFTELRLNFQTVRNFIQTNVKDYDENMSGEAREYLLYRTEMTHTHISDIIRKLKNIIKRESSESSELKMLLIRIGGPDKNTARYRWMVSKCLQQATVLEQSLRLMLTFIYNEDKSVSKENIPPIVNIYE